MNITEELVNEIRNKTNIVEVISNYVPLTQRGKNYFGVCPFHDDHSPSMSVSPDKQIYKCFSCGATGNVFTFVAEKEHINYYEAVRLLGNKLGYNLGIGKTNVVKEKSLEIYDLACKFYQNTLNTSLGKNALEYLDKRLIDNEAIKKFRVGLSVANTSLTNFLLSKKYQLKDLIDLGLSNEKGSDLFINRIMFPLYDLQGNVVAFSGRIYNTKDSSKYINSKETKIFKKGNLLYNYHQAKEILKKSESIIVMEGFMDVIRSSIVGINNCVATMGTAFTKQHALILTKTTDNIILCFDGDSAGEEATISAIQVLKEVGVTPKVIRLPEDLDPDEFIIKYGKEKFMDYVNNPISSIEFMMNIHKGNKNFKDPNDTSKYVNETLNDLMTVEDPILVELTLKKLSKEFEIDYKLLKDKYDMGIKNKKVEQVVVSPKKVTSGRLTQYDKASRYIVYYMLNNPSIVEMISKKVSYFKDENIRILYNEIICFYNKYQTINLADFISYISSKEEVVKIFNEIINLDIKEEYSEEEINDYIKVINDDLIKNKEKELKNKIKEETDPKRQAELLSEFLSLKGVK